MSNTRSMKAAASAALALGLVGCSVSVDPDEVALEYNAGSFSSTTFDQCIDSGNREYYGPGDKVYVYPGGQRTFTFSGADDAEMSAETVVSKDGMEMKVSGNATFQLNPECGALQSFHELIGKKYEAHTTDGWRDMLVQYFGQPLRRALDDATTEFDAMDLYTQDEAKAAWEDRVGELFKDYVEEMGGGEYFISPVFAEGDEEPGNPQFTIQRPVPREDVRDAMNEAHTIAQQIENTDTAAELAEKEAEAIAPLVELLGPDAYVVWEAIKSGEVDAIVLGDGSATIPSGGN